MGCGAFSFQNPDLTTARCASFPVKDNYYNSERHPPAEVGEDGQQGDFLPGFGDSVEVEHEGVEVVGDVADTHVDTVLGAVGLEGFLPAEVQAEHCRHMVVVDAGVVFRRKARR